MTARVSIATALMLWLTASGLYAARDAALARGVVSSQIYSVNDLDDISAFSGNLGVTIPIGQEYRTSGSLSYQFTLRYNSNVWDYIQHSVGANSVVRSPNRADLFLFDAYDDSNFPNAPTEGMESYPARSANAGLGWIVSFGELKVEFDNSSVPALVYVAADGSEHSFFDSLHGAASEVQNGNGPFYSRDGSYLRMRRFTAVGSGPQQVEIQFPSGIVQRFGCNANCYSFNALWLLNQIADPYGNLLEITRSSATRPAKGSSWVWTFNEYLGTTMGYKSSGAGLPLVRSHRLTFDVTEVYAHTSQMRIRTLELAASHGRTATYTFEYTNALIYRDAQHGWADTTSDRFLVTPFDESAGAPNPRMIRASLLERVLLPPNEGQSGPSGRWQFDYIGDQCTPNAACADASDLHLRTFGTVSFNVSRHFARLKHVIYPTGGGTRYTYQTRAFRKGVCDGGGRNSGGPEFSSFLGVRTREVGAFSGNDGTRTFTPDGDPWIYDGLGYKVSEQLGCYPTEFVATEIDPLGKATLSYFSIFLQRPFSGGYDDWSVTEHSMPFSRLRRDPTDQTHFGSTSIYTCDPGMFRGLDANTLKSRIRDIDPLHRAAGAVLACSATPVRQTFVRYESSSTFGCDSTSWTACEQSNRRRASMRTYYHQSDDPAASDASPVYTEVTEGDFDGLGHYRQTTSRGNLLKTSYPSSTRNETRVSFTGYNPGVVYDSATYAITGLPVWTAPWIMDLYDRTSVSENNEWSKARYAFDAGSGFLQSVRTLAKKTTASGDAELSANDLLTTRVRAVENGSVLVSEGYSGGDTQTLGVTAATLFREPTAGVRYEILTTSRAGGLVKKEYRGCTPFVVENNDVDGNTGLITIARDGSNVTASYRYDQMGRIAKIFPPFSVASASCTNPATQQCETVRVYTYPTLLTASGTITDPDRTVRAELELRKDGSTREQEWFVYDHLGRLTSEQRQLAGALNAKERGYLPMGLLSWESTGGEKNVSSSKRTRYSYDALGRRRCIQHPGSQAASCGQNDTLYTTIAYAGVRQTALTTYGIATGLTSTGSVTRTERADSHARLIAVIENSNGLQTTRYDYDMRDRLVNVNEGSGRSRIFEYDGRGFLAEEDHPELGSSAVKYGRFDARGNLGERTVNAGSQGPFDLTYRYDGAERLVEIRSKSPDRVLKTFSYDGGGRVTSAVRWNYVPDPTSTGVTLTEPITVSMAYDLNTGQALSKSASGTLGTTVQYKYNASGAVGQITYPSPVVNSTIVGPSRVLDLGYQYGSLTSVLPYITSITYARSGLPADIYRNNGTRDAIQSDTLLPRPLSYGVKTDVGTLLWTTGTYAYDGAGNIKAVVRSEATDRYAYDDVGRLTSVSLGRNNLAFGPAAITGLDQSYTYDRWGNITSINTNGVVSAVPVDSVTNRLAPPVADTTNGYDSAGNLKAFVRDGYAVNLDLGPFNLPIRSESSKGATFVIGRIYLYDAFDERIAMKSYYASGGSPSSAVKQLWTVRGMNQEVLREFEKSGTGAWAWRRDTVFRGTTPAVSIGPTGTQHLHADHLGTPRYITAANAQPADYRLYLPFGTEVQPRVDANRLKFTGHERDDDGGADTAGDLDYMHARFYSPDLGRFLSVDPAWASSDVGAPQTWNRYTYARNNPLTFTDPDGKIALVDDLAVLATAGAVILTTYVASPSALVPGKTNGQVLVESAVEGAEALGRWLVSGNTSAGGGAEPSAEVYIENWAAAQQENALPKPRQGAGTVPKAERDKKRVWTEKEKQAQRDKQGGKCANGCGTDLDKKNSRGHHVDRHADGGKTDDKNHAQVCKECHDRLHSPDGP